MILEESRYRLKRFKTFVIEELERQASSLGSVESLLEAILAREPDRWASLQDLSAQIKRSKDDTKGLLDQLAVDGKAVALGQGSRWIHAQTLQLCLEEVRDAIGGWFEEHPMRARMDVRDLRSACRFDQNLLGVVLDLEAEDGRVELSAGGFLRPAGRRVALDPETESLRGRVLEVMEAARFSLRRPRNSRPRSPRRWRASRACSPCWRTRARCTGSRGTSSSRQKAMAEAEAAVVSNCEANGGLEIPELRDALGTTRKFLIPILEHFDAMGVTMRQAGRRVLKRH